MLKNYGHIKALQELLDLSENKFISIICISNQAKLTMQFVADVVKKMSEKSLLTKNDLYTLCEQEVIDKIENCEDENISKCFKLFRDTTKINESDEPVLDKYCINVKAKRRYIVPLANNNGNYKRISNVSLLAKEKIENYLNWETKKYAYLDFDFK